MTHPPLKQKAQPATVALFVSDLHLQPALRQTTKSFLEFLEKQASLANQLYLLGDIFEYWAGDDDLPAPYHQQIVLAIRKVSDAGVAVFWIAGNRDFLVGDSFAKAVGATILPDPSIIHLGSKTLVLTHGDACCTDDIPYMEFRAKVRQPEWQKAFLNMPLSDRKSIIDGMREGSRTAQQTKSASIMDVNPEAIASVFQSQSSQIMIHGHTHRPGRHEHEINGENHLRYVLPDWDCDVLPKRGGWLAADPDGKIKRYAFDGEPVL